MTPFLLRTILRICLHIRACAFLRILLRIRRRAIRCAVAAACRQRAAYWIEMPFWNSHLRPGQADKPVNEPLTPLCRSDIECPLQVWRIFQMAYITRVTGAL